MRLFIAIQLDETVRNALLDLQDAMRRQGIRGSYTPPENLHLTLAFLGEYGAPEAAAEALMDVPLRPFRLGLEGFGRFGDLYWAGLGRSGELDAYVKRLRRALAEREIPFDRKRFSPHITLLRLASGDPRGLEVPRAEMEVRRVSLMRSDRGRHGMIYTELSCADAPD